MPRPALHRLEYRFAVARGDEVEVVLDPANPVSVRTAFGDRSVLDAQYDSMAAHVRRAASLVSPTGRHRSIAATARACGFADPSHFTRRFKDAYGLPPREWQRSSAPR